MEGKESTEEMRRLYHCVSSWAASERAHHQSLHRKASQIPRKRKKGEGRNGEASFVGLLMFMYPGSTASPLMAHRR